MSMPITTQTFVITVSASIMPEMTEEELHDAVAKLAYRKESTRGMGFLQIRVDELDADEAADVADIIYDDEPAH